MPSPPAGHGFLFSGMELSQALIQDLRRLNPFWEGQPLQPLPTTRRHIVENIQRRLKSKIAPIVILKGPRQVGKTTAQLQILEDLLGSGVPANHILRFQADELLEIKSLSEPILRVVEWFERVVLRRSLNKAAQEGQPAYLLLDEVQNLTEWAPQLKHLVDTSSVRILVTGSSALRIERGRDSLAGRIATVETGTLSLTEIGAFHGLKTVAPYLPDNGIDALASLEFWSGLRSHGLEHREFRDAAFEKFSERGGYPRAHEQAGVSWGQIADHLNETVVRRVIQHDLRVGDKGRKRDPELLEELFRLACRYAGQTPTYTLFAREVQRALEANIGVNRVRQYMRFLADTLLVRIVDPLEIRMGRRKGNPKICLVDHGLRASWLQEVIPLTPSALAENVHLTGLAGHLAESVTGALLSTFASLDIAHLPERAGDPEIDFVLTIGTRRIPVEVKYQRKIDELRDTEGLRSFIERKVNNAPFGLLVTLTDGDAVRDPRIVTLPLSSLMLLR